MTKHKQLLHRCGNVLAVLGVFFVIWKLWQWREQIPWEILSPVMVAKLICIALISACFGIFLVLGWRKILLHYGESLSFREAINLYGTSQLAKYVPGNVVQFIARQAMGNARGIPHKVLVLSSLWELILVCIGGGMYVIFVLSYIGKVSFLSKFYIFDIPIGMSVVFFVLFYFSVSIALYKLYTINLAYAIGYYCFYMLLAGTIFALIVNILAPQVISVDNVLFFTCAAITSFLAGLVTPGAPSGVGVREIVLLFFLNYSMQTPTILMAVLLWRCVTVLGDLIFYCFSYFVYKTKPV